MIARLFRRARVTAAVSLASVAGVAVLVRGGAVLSDPFALALLAWAVGGCVLDITCPRGV